MTEELWATALTLAGVYVGISLARYREDRRLARLAHRLRPRIVNLQAPTRAELDPDGSRP